MIRLGRTWRNTSSEEANANEKCNGSYSNEHSLIPVKDHLKCVHCGIEVKK